MSDAAFYRHFDLHAVTVDVDGAATSVAGAVCHSWGAEDQEDAKCLCGAGREQIDGVCTVCPDGRYNLQSDGERCTACPAGATCTGGTSITSPRAAYAPAARWRTLPGYWVAASVWRVCAPDDPACFLGRVERCGGENAGRACPGGAPGTCGQGFDPGTSLCGRCVAGYARDELNQRCKRCEGRTAAWLQMAGICVGIVVALYGLYMLMHRLRRDIGIAVIELIETGLDHAVLGLVSDGSFGAVSGLVNVITGYLQVMGQSITGLSIDFPSLVSGLFEVLSWFTLPVASFMGAQCFTYFTTGPRYEPFVMGFSFQAALPWFIVGFYAALFLAIRRFGSPRGDIFVKVVCFLLTYVHPGVSATIFRLYNCRSIVAWEAGRQDVLEADAGIECFKSPQWRAMAVVSVFMLVAFIVAWPLAIFVLLRRLRCTPMRDGRGRIVWKKVRADRGWPVAHDPDKKPIVAEVKVPCSMLDDPTTQAMYGSLYLDFEPEYFWFQTYEITRRLAQTAGVVLVSTLFGAKYELHYACAAAFFFGTLHALFMPYRYGALDYLQMNVLGGQARSYFLLHLWQVGITTDERGVDVAVFLIQLILGVSFIVLLVVYLLPGLQEDVIPAARDLQRRLSRQLSRQLSLSSLSSLPRRGGAKLTVDDDGGLEAEEGGREAESVEVEVEVEDDERGSS